ncbi:hypothetical protein FB451DRAFT_1173448 [Mycena latifolia]|nr:hypothetical protein FB451DRAFT_1173448 [Mycena latifolia]
MAVPDEQARNQPPPPSPTPHTPPGWTQAPQLGYGASDRGSSPQPSQDLYPPQTASQFNPGPGVLAPMTEPTRYPPQLQYPVDGDYIPYTSGGTANQQARPQLAHPSLRRPNQPPAGFGHPSEYPQYFANFGFNNAANHADLYPRRSMLLWRKPMMTGCGTEHIQ